MLLGNRGELCGVGESGGINGRDNPEHGLRFWDKETVTGFVAEYVSVVKDAEDVAGRGHENITCSEVFLQPSDPDVCIVDTSTTDGVRQKVKGTPEPFGRGDTGGDTGRLGSGVVGKGDVEWVSLYGGLYEHTV